MRILVFGGTGLIGNALLAHPDMHHHELIVVTRSVPAEARQGLITHVNYEKDILRGLFRGHYGVINLAGAGIGDRLWSKKRKAVILGSRIKVAGMIAELVNQADDKPVFILQASAVGYYGNRGEEELDEGSSAGQGFLPEVTGQWEKSLAVARPEPTRIIFLRTGLVLSRRGGLLGRLRIPFRWFVGGHFGSGRQWMPWIHMDDEIGAILFLISHGQASGIYNLASPNPVRMKDFCRQLGAVLKRPSWLHIPAVFIRMIPGGFGEELLLTSQRVKPEKLIRAGYTFAYPNLAKALSNLFGNE